MTVEVPIRQAEVIDTLSQKIDAFFAIHNLGAPYVLPAGVERSDGTVTTHVDVMNAMRTIVRDKSGVEPRDEGLLMGMCKVQEVHNAVPIISMWERKYPGTTSQTGVA